MCKLVSSRFERLNVEPNSDRSQYPEVTLDSTGPYCDCKVQEYLENPVGIHIGSMYCSKHNVILVEGIFEPDDLKTIADITVYIINHETIHWIICKEFDKKTSINFDKTDPIAPLI